MQSPVKKIYITQVFGVNAANYAKFGLNNILVESSAVRTNCHRLAKFFKRNFPHFSRNSIYKPYTKNGISNIASIFVKNPPTRLFVSIRNCFTSFVGSLVKFTNLNIYCLVTNQHIKWFRKSLPHTSIFKGNPLLPAPTLPRACFKPFGSITVFKRVSNFIVSFGPRQLVTPIRAIFNTTAFSFYGVNPRSWNFLIAKITHGHNYNYRLLME